MEDEDLRKEVRNRVTMLGEQIAAEVAPSEPNRRAWMMIGPNQSGGVMLVEFELDLAVDTEGWLAPDDILNRKTRNFKDLDEVVGELERRGVETALFDAPWKSDYPL